MKVKLKEPMQTAIILHVKYSEVRRRIATESEFGKQRILDYLDTLDLIFTVLMYFQFRAVAFWQ